MGKRGVKPVPFWERVTKTPVMPPSRRRGARRWRRALAAARGLLECGTMPDGTSHPGCNIWARDYDWFGPWTRRSLHDIAASLALDGMPATWPRKQGRERR